MLVIVLYTYGRIYMFMIISNFTRVVNSPTKTPCGSSEIINSHGAAFDLHRFNFHHLVELAFIPRLLHGLVVCFHAIYINTLYMREHVVKATRFLAWPPTSKWPSSRDDQTAWLQMLRWPRYFIGSGIHQKNKMDALQKFAVEIYSIVGSFLSCVVWQNLISI